MSLTTVSLEPPYLLYLGDVADDDHAKTGFGLAYWRPELCAGQMRLPDCPVDLGLPEMSVADAVDAGVLTAIIGVAPVGAGALFPAIARILTTAFLLGSAAAGRY